MLTRRDFLKNAGGTGALALLPAVTAAAAERDAPAAGSGHAACQTLRISLDGEWQFRTDADNRGERAGWFKQLPDSRGTADTDWESVTVPHTWQVQEPYQEYKGIAWYRKLITVPGAPAKTAGTGAPPPAGSETITGEVTGEAGKTIRIEFEAVFHSARVWINGIYAGEHLRKGYTAFQLDVSGMVRPGENYLAVRVNNRFDDKMLPRNDSYDWAADGGITRSVSMLISPKTYIDKVWVRALPDLAKKQATLKATAMVCNHSKELVNAGVAYEVLEEKTGRRVLTCRLPETLQLKAGECSTISLPEAILEQPKLWHFDQPNLYRLVARLEIAKRNGARAAPGDSGRPHDSGRLHESGGAVRAQKNAGAPESSRMQGESAGRQRLTAVHIFETSFGIRKIEIKNSGFYLNGERVWLAGVERMGGSHPLYGMAEPASWIVHNHQDMKNLNCIFTRVHWQQDKSVLDYCDRHGMLIQVEVPTWGGGTFKGMENEPDNAIMQNGLEQLREMIGREYNHPSVFSWGLCNEIGGQNPPAYKFAAGMLKEAKRLDPDRLCTYASNSLHYTPEKDVSGLMDFIEWNEYYESWLEGDAADMEKNLQAIHSAFPDKPLVISEYGWCRCTPERKEGDEQLISILRRHNAIFRKYDYVAGLIFFSYNDYRTHMGDKGIGVLQQRVHGVTDLYGERKPSYQALREESSPLERLTAEASGTKLRVALQTRQSIPAYQLHGYLLRWTGYARQDIPLETSTVALPVLNPGETHVQDFDMKLSSFEKIKAEVFRPTGSSVVRVILKK